MSGSISGTSGGAYQNFVHVPRADFKPLSVLTGKSDQYIAAHSKIAGVVMGVAGPVSVAGTTNTQSEANAMAQADSLLNTLI